MPFTREELAEMAAADAEIERSFRITSEERRRSRELDADGRCDALIGTDRYRSAAARKDYYEANREKIAAAKKAYYEANREEIAAYKKEYYEANREKIAAGQKEYYEANREKIAAARKAYREANREKYNAYMREYNASRRRRKGEKPMEQEEQNGKRIDPILLCGHPGESLNG